MNRAIVGVGSNIEPERYILQARELIDGTGTVLAESTFVETPAINRPELPDFVNGAWLIETTLDQEAFTQELKNIEHACDRVRCEDRFASRTMDLDLILWNDSIVDADYYTRDFLQDAVRELLPDFHPGS